MINRIQYIITHVLLASYLTVGAVGHLEAIGKLFQFGSRPEKVEQQLPARPAPERVYWTQHKHIPQFTKIASPSSAVVIPCELPRPELFATLLTAENGGVTATLSTSCTFSRAPPSAATS